MAIPSESSAVVKYCGCGWPVLMPQNFGNRGAEPPATTCGSLFRGIVSRYFSKFQVRIATVGPWQRFLPKAAFCRLSKLGLAWPTSTPNTSTAVQMRLRCNGPKRSPNGRGLGSGSSPTPPAPGTIVGFAKAGLLLFVVTTRIDDEQRTQARYNRFHMEVCQSIDWRLQQLPLRFLKIL